VSIEDTRTADYTDRLTSLSTKRWKRLVPNPYRSWLRSKQPGFTLDIGCGTGRSLAMIHGNGVGVDHNFHSVKACRHQGFAAFTPDEFKMSEYAVPDHFDSLLCSHVLEHLDVVAADGLLATYIPYVRRGGRVMIVTPQERGYASDPSHVRFVDDGALEQLSLNLGLTDVRTTSFPLPRAMGRAFIYNEFTLIGTVS